MKKSKIVCTGPIEQISIDIMEPFGEVVIAPDPSKETLLGLVRDADALVVRGDNHVDAEVIQEAKTLKVIARTGAGYDCVDLAAATARKIPLVYAPGANSRAVAEAGAALILVLSKKIFHWDRELKRGNWKSRFESKPGDLEGATLGIIGLGKIGQILAELVSPFKMKLLAHDPYVEPERAKQLNVELVSLDDLLRSSDFISLHSPLNEQTRGLINKESLKLVKPGAYLINLARGGVIKSLDVLYDALKDGTLAGVGLDAFEPEPPDVTHPIFKLSNCVTSPHALAVTPRAMDNIFRSIAEDVVAVLGGDRPQFVVNPEVFE